MGNANSPARTRDQEGSAGGSDGQRVWGVEVIVAQHPLQNLWRMRAQIPINTLRSRQLLARAGATWLKGHGSSRLLCHPNLAEQWCGWTKPSQHAAEQQLDPCKNPSDGIRVAGRFADHHDGSSCRCCLLEARYKTGAAEQRVLGCSCYTLDEHIPKLGKCIMDKHAAGDRAPCAGSSPLQQHTLFAQDTTDRQPHRCRG